MLNSLLFIHRTGPTFWQLKQFSQYTHNRCTFEYPIWGNLCGPSLDCTANLQLTTKQFSQYIHITC